MDWNPLKAIQIIEHHQTTILVAFLRFLQAIQTEDRLSLDLPLDQGEQRRSTQQAAARHVSHVAAEMGR